MSLNTENTRFTATLPTDYIEQLKEMAKAKHIPSINFALREALRIYLEQVKKERFNELMKEASKDEEFLERMSECEKDFEFVDNEVVGEW